MKNVAGTNESLTRRIGLLGEIKTQCLLIEQGFDVCVPLGDNSPFDIVAIREHLAIKIQVKYSSIDTANFAKVKLSNTHYVSSKKKWTGHFYKIENVDIFAIVTERGIAFIENRGQHSVNIYFGTDSPRQKNTIVYQDCTLEKAIENAIKC